MVQLTVNGIEHRLDIEPEAPLLWVIREDLRLTGTKYGCGLAQCGACTVLVNGVATRSCVTPVSAVEGAAVTTIEAIEQDQTGARVVAAWIDHQVPQCGYCQSGQVMAATSLFKQNKNPSEAEVQVAMTNFCRCGTYNAISDAIASLKEA